MTEATQRYTGTKIVLGTPMTRGDYNTLRGWTLPADENGDDTGYLVEYTDGIGKPNLEGHEGYVSWSPSDVFEGSYKPISDDWRERLALESQQLEERLTALKAFFQTSQYVDLPQNPKDLMQVQAQYMSGYADVLGQRLALVSVASPIARQAQRDGTAQDDGDPTNAAAALEQSGGLEQSDEPPAGAAGATEATTEGQAADDAART